jgi:hypothetical protein
VPVPEHESPAATAAGPSLFTARFMHSGNASAARRPGGAGVPARRMGLVIAAAAAIGLPLLLLGGGRHDDGDRDRMSTPAAPLAVSVQIDPRHRGSLIPGRFLGLSFEASALPEIASYAEQGNLVALLRSLGPGVLRFGGVSADTRIAWTDGRTQRPAWASSALGSGDLRRLGRLAARSGWRVLLTVGLAHYSPASAAREAAAAKAALGPWLAGIEVGNEPDAYAHHHFRALPWTYRRYDAEVRRYRRAIARAAPGIALAGPGVSGSRAFKSWGPREARWQRPSLLTGHHYPLGCHQTPAPSTARLLSAPIHALEGASLNRFMSASRPSSIPFRLDEVNSVSCGGSAGISDTFASALWATGYMVQAMTAGVSGVNFQGNPANCHGYSPLCAATPQRLAGGLLRAQPEWYALLIGRMLLGGRPLRTTVTAPQPANVLARSFIGSDGRLRVVIVEDDPPGARAAAVGLHVGSGYRLAGVLRLSASSPAALTGVTLGARAVANDGSWSAPAHLAQIAVHGGVLSLTVPTSSAAVVTLSPAQTRPGP